MDQQGLAFGLDRKRHGLDRVEQNEPGKVLEELRDFAKKQAYRYGQVCIDDVRWYAQQEGLTVHHPNVWGAVFRSAHWRCTGHRKSCRPSSHARMVKVWRWVP